MNLLDLLSILRRRWLLAVIPAAIVLLVTLVTADEAVVPGPVYNVGVRFLVAPPPIDPDSDPDIVPGEENRYYQWLTSEYVVNGMADWVNSIDFAERVSARAAADSGLEIDPLAIFGGTSGEAIRSRLTLTMNLGDRAALEAAINAAIAVILEDSGQVIPHQPGQAAAVTLLDRPLINEIAPPITGQLDLPLRIVIALAAGVLVALLAHYFDPFVRSREDVEALVKMIGEDVRAAVMLANQRIVIVCGPRPTPGCPSLAANLAASLAQVGRATLLIDAAGGLDEQVGFGGGAGVIEALTGQLVARHQTAVDRLSYLSRGGNSGQAAAGVLRDGWMPLLEEAEAVVIHAPPLLDDPTAVWLAAQLNAGVVLAITKGRTKRVDLAAAKTRLADQGAVLIGAVFLNS